MKLDQAQVIEQATRVCSRADFGTTVLNMRSAGVDVSAARRDELLAKARAGEHVELELEVLAYEQKPGEQNRKFVRFRDGAMMKLGASGRGNPVLRDHDQHDLTARAGTVISSKTEKRADGDYIIHQVFKLTAPWAVEMALRGLLDTVSIGWNPTGDVNCSACDTPIFTKCWHLPGDRLTADADTSKGRASSDIVVEWIFTAAELVETSLVSVPAVPRAQIEGIRAALAAGPQLHGGQPQKEMHMSKLPVLATKLGLAATAGEDELITAVEALSKDRDTLSAKLTIADAERVKLSAIVDEHRNIQRKADEDGFIRDALSSGRIGASDEAPWRKLFGLDAAGAKEEMGKRAVGCATPVGLARQSGGPVPAQAPVVVSKEVDETLSAAGVDPGVARSLAHKFGAKEYDKTLSKELGLKGRV